METECIDKDLKEIPFRDLKPGDVFGFDCANIRAGIPSYIYMKIQTVEIKPTISDAISHGAIVSRNAVFLLTGSLVYMEPFRMLIQLDGKFAHKKPI